MQTKPGTGLPVKACERRKEYLCDLEMSCALCSSACTAWPAQEKQPSPPASVMACTNLLDRLAVRFRGQKFMRGFIACFPGATSVKSLRSSSGQVPPEKEVSKCWGIQQVTRKKAQACFSTQTVFAGQARLEEKVCGHLLDTSPAAPSSLLDKLQRVPGGEKKPWLEKQKIYARHQKRQSCH